MSPDVEGPIFIGGAGRSGKTLLRWILSSHPRIVVSRRTDMWPRFFGRYGDLSQPANLERCLQALFSRKQIAALRTDEERLRRDFGRGEATYARLFALIHEQFAERSRKPRWGDQTDSVERYAQEIVSAYQGARLIQLVRDPRDRYEAILARGRIRPGGVGLATAEWLASVTLARRNEVRYPGSCHVVRYESLVAEPEDTVRAVCMFIGEVYDPAMLRMEGVGRYDTERAASADGIPISTDHVGRHRLVDQGDLAFIQSVAGREMAAFGYQPSDLRLTPSERLRWVAVGWPVNITSLGSRRVMDALRSRPGTRAASESRT